MPSVGSRTVEESRATVVRLMVPSESNFMGNVFGGSILAEIDRTAYITATRHAGGTSVTASFDRVDFIAPVHVGDVVEFDATMTYVGTSSMEVWVAVRAEDLKGTPPRAVVNAYVTMVAIDEEGRPREVPRLKLRTKSERQRFAEAARRVQARRRGRPARRGN